MRRFDPTTQRSSEEVAELRVTPAREGLPRLYRPEWDAWLTGEAGSQDTATNPYLEFFLPWMDPDSGGLLEYLPAESIVLFEDLASFEDSVNELEEQAVKSRQELRRVGRLPRNFPLPYLTLADLAESLGTRQSLDMGLMTAASPLIPELSQAIFPGSRFAGQLRPLMDHIGAAQRKHDTLLVASRQAARLAELWAGNEGRRPTLDTLPEPFLPGGLYFLQGALTEGWVLKTGEGGTIHLITDAEIFGWARLRRRPRPLPPATSPETAYADLDPGAWVVHVDFGIGQFRGLVERTIEGYRREYLLIEYAEGDQVYVPIHQADRITAYVGVDGTSPSPSRLGTREWERVKGRAKHAVEEVARDLLELYARRMTATGHAFSPDTDWQAELEASFPYRETADQLGALDAIKSDMESSRPMDRLICGDSGYGKTEVALRASFKALMDGKQVAILVPTTILAQQHFKTFRQRLAAFPAEVEMLSRFRSRAEAEPILRRLASGKIDIVIGTHRLLQQDVEFKDLGLLIIDEEQRFGVTHKEHLKSMRTEVDVLTLTATPIPRTLYMALTGARDISTINTPPEERLPVITHVGKYDPHLIRQAVLRELSREGQVYFVHNRVKTIEAVRSRLQKLLPGVLIEVAHGQMPEPELASVMERFAGGQIDVLVCTSIVETGLDIPNANTLIVDQAELFGLGQMYQLRGRVGRGTVRGFAYFFRNLRLRATEEALERLEILAEHTELGSGYSIALRDLEMRGAGDILGTRQHGHIAALGFHLYTRMLATAVHQLKAEYGGQPPKSADLLTAAGDLPVSIDLPLPTAIPADYVPDRNLRLQMYRRMADLRTFEEIDSLGGEFMDRFGPLPAEVENLLYQLRVKIIAAEAKVTSISVKHNQLHLRLPASLTENNIPDLGPDVRRSKTGLWLARGSGNEWTERLMEILSYLRSAA